MMLNRVLNTKEFVATKQFSNAEGGNGKDFLQIFQSKVQTKDNNYQRTFSSIDNTRITTDKKALGSNGRDFKNTRENNDAIVGTSVEEVKEEEKLITSTKFISTEEENCNIKFLIFESEEEKPQQYEGIIPPQLLQQLEEILMRLYQQGYFTQDEVEKIAVKFEETDTLKEVISLLDSDFQRQDIIIDGHHNNFEKVKAVEEFSKLAKTILEERTKEPIDRIGKEVPQPENSIKVEKVVVEKISEGFAAVLVGEEKSEENKLLQNVLDTSNVDKSVKTEGVEKAEDIVPYSVIDLNKNFDVKFNSVTNQPLNTEGIYGKNLLEQLIHKVDEVYKTGKNQLKLQLVPENLGKLSINLSSENQMVKAKVYVESLQVKEAIENSLNEFKDSLKEKGINITNVEVSVGQDPETFQQRRNFTQQKIKYKKDALNVDEVVGAIPGIDAMVNANPYMVTTGFDELG